VTRGQKKVRKGGLTGRKRESLTSENRRKEGQTGRRARERFSGREKPKRARVNAAEQGKTEG